MKHLLFLSLLSLPFFSFTKPSSLLGATGKITMLRVHDVGTRYGPPQDQIDVEAVIQLDTQPGKSFGFQMRNDANALARQGMLALLRDAFIHNWTVRIDYSIEEPKKNGIILRAWVNK
ncbi:MAG TPA: hypothetical protein VL832_04790 [Puia sp.]|nr:hypothetical protein [Puia sp.]